MFFYINKRTPFGVHRIDGQKEGSSRVVVTISNQNAVSFNFDADIFLSAFKLVEGADPTGKRMLVLRVEEEEIVLCYGLSPKAVEAAKRAFLEQLQQTSRVTMNGSNTPHTSQYVPVERRFKKRYLGGVLLVALGAFLFWPIENKELVEITDPIILELIRAQQEGNLGTLGSQQATNSAQAKADRDRRTKAVEHRTEIIQQANSKKVRTTGFLSLDGSQVIHGAAANYSITLGDGNRASNIPYLVFSSPRDVATTELILNTEDLGYTPVLIPVGFEENVNPDDDTLVRVIASYCSADPIVMWTKPIITEQDLAQSFMDSDNTCDWESALFNFNSAWGVASTDGLTETPFIVAPSGAIHQHDPSERISAEALVEWLSANPSK